MVRQKCSGIRRSYLAVELTKADRAVAQPLCWQNSVLQKSSYCRWSRHQVCPQMALLPLICRWS
nr:hypothetical protein FBNJHNGD_00037 [Escherichia coli]WEG97358.1 hypothetical protein LDCBLOMN_00039 [Escherichia coli]